MRVAVTGPRLCESHPASILRGDAAALDHSAHGFVIALEAKNTRHTCVFLLRLN
jgi:hypothetical protein